VVPCPFIISPFADGIIGTYRDGQSWALIDCVWRQSTCFVQFKSNEMLIDATGFRVSFFIEGIQLLPSLASFSFSSSTTPRHQPISYRIHLSAFRVNADSAAVGSGMND